jgi:hypothetical protein
VGRIERGNALLPPSTEGKPGDRCAFVLRLGLVVLSVMLAGCSPPPASPGSSPHPGAYIHGTGPGWHTLGEADFVDVNGDPETWTFDGDFIRTTGVPIGVIRSSRPYTNLELVVEWRHLEFGGNSGIFLWVPGEALENLPPDRLPNYGIEIQMLDHGYHQLYQQRTGRRGEFFSTHGDVFAVGESKLEPFPPLSPNGSRSFPSEERSKGVGEWNHYYVRAVNGEVRLWVNGAEVSGGTAADPRSGYLCLEAEGSPVEFRNLRVRELP